MHYGNSTSQTPTRCLAALVAALVLLCGCGAPTPPEPFHSVVLVTIDTLRADHVGAYGYPRPTTPFLDTLAEQAVLFENAYSSSSHTAPSHTSLFTSLSPASHGVLTNGTRLPRGLYTTLAETLAQNGFSTGAFTSARFLRQLGRGFRRVDIPNSKQLKQYTHRRAQSTVSAALKWLAKQSTDSSVFLWVHLFDVHERQERIPLGKFLTRVRGKDVSDREFEAHLKTVMGLDHLDEERRREIDRYDAQLAYADSQIARLYRRVGDLRPSGPVLWIVTADHGEGLWNHDYRGHGRYLYREQLRVPLIVHAQPPRWQPARVSSMVRLLDLYPTVMEMTGLAGFETLQDLEGFSLAPLLTAPDRVLPFDHLFAQRRPIDASRARLGWEDGVVLAAQNLEEKYVYFETRPDEYYDLTIDPLELNNLADQNLPEAESLRVWLMNRYRELQENGPREQEILPEHIEELKALGYIN